MNPDTAVPAFLTTLETSPLYGWGLVEAMLFGVITVDDNDSVITPIFGGQLAAMQALVGQWMHTENTPRVPVDSMVLVAEDPPDVLGSHYRTGTFIHRDGTVFSYRKIENETPSKADLMVEPSTPAIEVARLVAAAAWPES